MTQIFRILVALSAVGLILLSLIQLHASRSGISITKTHLFGAPATLYEGETQSDLLVIISHGFAGSRQMMEGISLSLAKAGHRVVAFDYLGHGRHDALLSPDITSVTGTTEDLVQQTIGVAQAARALSGQEELVLVGHSMATDVIIRAATRLDRVRAIAAISIYSEAVTAAHPEKLLIISGAQETRLRAVALSMLEQIGGTHEGMTFERDGIERRAAVAPHVGHVGVLWSRTTSWPISQLIPQAPIPAPPSLKRAVVAATVPAPFAVLGSFINLPFLELSGFGALFLFFAIWGSVGLIVLRWRPQRDARATILSAFLLLIWGLGGFALALDTYGAAFLPTGPRLPLMMLLLPATLAFSVAIRASLEGRHWLIKIALHLPVLIALFAAMVLNVANLGMLFTVLPVLVLFLLVYGTMVHWAARRAGPLGPSLASGVILAWAIAASTPLFAVS